MSKACPTCGRLGTVHRTNGHQTCYGCDPPLQEEMQLVEVTVKGRQYYVAAVRCDSLLRTVADQKFDDKGNVLISDDTGLCGPEAIKTAPRRLEDWLASEFDAFPTSDNEQRKRYESHVEQTLARAAEDAKR